MDSLGYDTLNDVYRVRLGSYSGTMGALDEPYGHRSSHQTLTSMEHYVNPSALNGNILFAFPSSTPSASRSVPTRPSPADDLERQQDWPSPSNRVGVTPVNARWTNPNLDLSEYPDPGDLALRKDLAKAPVFHNYPSLKDGPESEDSPPVAVQAFDRDDPGGLSIAVIMRAHLSSVSLMILSAVEAHALLQL